MSEELDLFDVVSGGSGEARVTVEAEAAPLDALARRAGVDVPAIWRATWALVLARLGGVERVRLGRNDTITTIDVPREGDVVAWLQSAGKTNGAPRRGVISDNAVEWRIDHARATATAAVERTSFEKLGELLRLAIGLVTSRARLDEISLLSAAERTLVLETWNQTAVSYRPEATVHALFREQASSHPERVAVAWDGGRLSYGELDRWTDALAERLIAAGVGTDQPVALAMERSPEAIVAALAILKAGGAYLPLDPEYPPDRLAFTVGDAGASVLVTTRARGDALAALASRTIFVEDAQRDAASVQPRVERATPRTRAYVMYTSGSTGTPKGVQIEHRSIVRLVGRPAYVELSPETRMLHAAPLGFDASTLALPAARAILLTAVAVAVCEELLFRGIVLHALGRAWAATRRGLFRALAFTSLLFAALHLVQTLVFLWRDENRHWLSPPRNRDGSTGNLFQPMR